MKNRQNDRIDTTIGNRTQKMQNFGTKIMQNGYKMGTGGKFEKNTLSYTKTDFFG